MLLCGFETLHRGETVVRRLLKVSREVGFLYISGWMNCPNGAKKAEQFCDETAEASTQK